MKKLILFVCLLALGGCGFVFKNISPEPAEGLEYGYSQEQVIAKIGRPDTIKKVRIADNVYDLWEYSRDEPKNEKINSLGQAALKLFFQDGKLVQHDQDRFYGQPQYEYIETVEPVAAVKSTTPEKIK